MARPILWIIGLALGAGAPAACAGREGEVDVEQGVETGDRPAGAEAEGAGAVEGGEDDTEDDIERTVDDAAEEAGGAAEDAVD